MSFRQQFEIPSALPQPIRGVVSAARSDRPLPTVIVCHGFKGFMDWGFFPPLATLLEERGFCVIRFNFAGSGVLPGSDLVDDLEAFRQDTFSNELGELDSILDSILGDRNSVFDDAPIDTGRIGLFGHSRGGGISILTAAQQRWASHIRALVTWAAVATFDRFDQKTKQSWRQHQGLDVANARTGQELTMGLEMLDDLETNTERLDIPAAARRRTAPWLIVHGEDDETVPIAEAELLAERGADPIVFERIASGSHTFGARHPFVGPTPALITALNATQTWLRRHL